MEMYRENSEAMADLCAANLTSLGRLYIREGRYRAAQEVLELAAKLGSLEAQLEMLDFHPSEGEQGLSRYVCWGSMS